MTPRYPIFIPSKGRANAVLTAKLFDEWKVHFSLVVEPQEADAYREKWGDERVVVLPENNKGLVYSRNWIRDKSVVDGYVRHWQFDDDIKSIFRLHKGLRLECDPGVGLSIVEDFVDRYTNVAIASLNDIKFLLAMKGHQPSRYPPFYLNSRCYTNFLVLNSIPYRWRGRYNEDTDMTLQALAGGWCTMLFNAIAMWSPATLSRGGGQMASSVANYNGNGRLHMARHLERVWPGVVTTKRKFGRAQHSVKYNWTRFNTPLQKSNNPPAPRDYGLKLEPINGKSNHNSIIQNLLDEQENR